MYKEDMSEELITQSTVSSTSHGEFTSVTSLVGSRFACGYTLLIPLFKNGDACL